MNKRVEMTKEALWSGLKNKENFFFLRYGDGDLNLMNGLPGEQRHKNSSSLKKELIESFLIDDSRYWQASTAFSYNDGTDSYFWIASDKEKMAFDRNLQRIQNKFRPNKIFYHTLAIQYLFEKETEWFIDWLKFLKDRKVLLIAGDALCGKKLVQRAYNISTEISFPGTKNAYYSLPEKMDKINKEVERHDVIIPVIGMATRVLGKRLFKNFAGQKTLIDMGVTTDALAEATHRGWTKIMIDKGIVEKCKGEFLNE